MHARGLHADPAPSLLFGAIEPHALVIDHDHLAVAPHDRALPCEIERHDGDVFEEDVLPYVELGPVGERENADRLALALARVIEAPQFRALVLGIPAVAGIAEGKDALLRPRLLFIAAGAAESGIE